jgi:SOS-response transcriptional repressor LexA
MNLEDFQKLVFAAKTKAKVKQGELAKKIGISGNYLSEMVTGKREITKNVVEALRNVIIDELAVENQKGLKSVGKVPVLGWAAASRLGNISSISHITPRTISAPAEDEYSFGLEIEGDSMEPQFSKGDIAIVYPSTLPKNGALVAVNHKTKGILFKKLYQPNLTDIFLMSFNPSYEPIKALPTDFHWIYYVAYVLKDTKID